jgi:enoyl-CoA hydratase/carnithine racemase
MVSDFDGMAGIDCIVIAAVAGRAFCAGGDVKKIYSSLVGDGKYARQFYRTEYELLARLRQCRVPVVCVADGMTYGGGAGLAFAGAGLTVVTGRTEVSMPECGLGLLPDVGASYFLRRLPGSFGFAVGLTGGVMGPSLSARLGARAVAVDATCEDVLAALEAVDGLLSYELVEERLLEVLMPLPLETTDEGRRPELWEAVLEAELETLPAKMAWATATTRRSRSVGNRVVVKPAPMSVALWRELWRRSRKLTLDDCMRLELEVIMRRLDDGDFAEGIRARLLDRERTAHWRPATLAEAASADLTEYFGDA